MLCVWSSWRRALLQSGACVNLFPATPSGKGRHRLDRTAPPGVGSAHGQASSGHPGRRPDRDALVLRDRHAGAGDRRHQHRRHPERQRLLERRGEHHLVVRLRRHARLREQPRPTRRRDRRRRAASGLGSHIRAPSRHDVPLPHVRQGRPGGAAAHELQQGQHLHDARRDPLRYGRRHRAAARRPALPLHGHERLQRQQPRRLLVPARVRLRARRGAHRDGPGHGRDPGLVLRVPRHHAAASATGPASTTRWRSRAPTASR